MESDKAIKKVEIMCYDSLDMVKMTSSQKSYGKLLGGDEI